MKNKKRACHRFCSALCALLIAFYVVGCGYSIQGKANLPFQSISIGKIVNKTFEPRLEDKMQDVLVEELMKNGFTLEQNSGYRIEGEIKEFLMNIFSEKNYVATQYEVIIKGDFKLIGPDGKIKKLASGGVFIVSFLSTETLNDVMAQKELAIERALRDFSTELIASIIYL